MKIKHLLQIIMFIKEDGKRNLSMSTRMKYKLTSFKL